jgi:hypothetical protein
MSVSALIADMVRAGVSADIIGRTAELLAQREPVALIDEQAERRREADRERKRLRKSAEICGIPSPLCPPLVPPTPPLNPPPISPHPQAAAAIAGDAIEIADRCIEALGPAASPISIGLQSSCPASRWIADGADLEADILPVMRRYAATKPPGSIRAWQAWMGQDVANHRARRLQPLPEGRATGPPARQTRTTAADFAAELDALTRGHHDHDNSREPSPPVPRLAYSAGHG